MAQPEARAGRDLLQSSVIGFNKLPGGVWPWRPVWHGPQVARNHAKILCLGRARDQDGQKISGRPKALHRIAAAGTRRAGMGAVKVCEQAASFGLH